MDAAYEPYCTLGYRNVSIKQTCTHAHLTGRHLYEEFGSSEALLRAVYDRTVRRAFDQVVGVGEALEWTSTGLCYFVDGYKTASEDYRWAENGGAQAAPAHVLLHLAIGGGWAGRYGIDDASFPTSFDIDRVRVYSKG